MFFIFRGNLSPMSPDSEHFPNNKLEPPMIAVTSTPISGTKPRAPPDHPITRQGHLIDRPHITTLFQKNGAAQLGSISLIFNNQMCATNVKNYEAFNVQFYKTNLSSKTSKWIQPRWLSGRTSGNLQRQLPIRMNQRWIESRLGPLIKIK